MKDLCIGIVIAIILLLVYCVIDTTTKCAEAGGVVVRSNFGNICINKDPIIKVR